MNYEYVFLERWGLAASPEEVFGALADFDLYARWGYPSYLAARRDGPIAVGCTGDVVVQGNLPYKVNLRYVTRQLEPARELAISVTGDLIGEAHWMLRPFAAGTELILDWRCDANWKVIRALKPVLEPLFRWNHSECMNRAIAGLAKYLCIERERVPPAAARRATRAKSSPASARA